MSIYEIRMGESVVFTPPLYGFRRGSFGDGQGHHSNWCFFDHEVGTFASGQSTYVSSHKII